MRFWKNIKRVCSALPILSLKTPSMKTREKVQASSMQKLYSAQLWSSAFLLGPNRSSLSTQNLSKCKGAWLKESISTLPPKLPTRATLWQRCMITIFSFAKGRPSWHKIRSFQTKTENSISSCTNLQDECFIILTSKRSIQRTAARVRFLGLFVKVKT